MITDDDTRAAVAALVQHIKPETRLRRRLAADYLAHLGFPISAATLASLVTRGGGPPLQHFGRTALYQAGPLVDWAEGRLSRPASSSAERSAA